MLRILVRAVGRGFIPGITPAKSAWALAPEGHFRACSSAFVHPVLATQKAIRVDVDSFCCIGLGFFRSFYEVAVQVLNWLGANEREGFKGEFERWASHGARRSRRPACVDLLGKLVARRRSRGSFDYTPRGETARGSLRITAPFTSIINVRGV
jgi:hypothetical protein